MKEINLSEKRNQPDPPEKKPEPEKNPTRAETPPPTKPPVFPEPISIQEGIDPRIITRKVIEDTTKEK